MRVVAVIAVVAALASSAAAEDAPSNGAGEAPQRPSQDVAKPASIDDQFRQFDLLGTWAVNCEQVASPENPHVEIASPAAGAVVERHDIGADYAVNTYSMLAAERLSATQLAVQVVFQPGTEHEERQRLVFRIRDKTRRTMFNQPEGGPVRVRDGIALANRSRTPLLKKCE